MTDLDLLKQYAKTHSEQAFAELVHRHLDWVYSAAIRQVHDRHLAEDLAQAVFIALAQRAKSLRRDESLSPWLLQVTRCAAINALRGQRRRQSHEQKAAAMRSESITAAAEPEWDQVAPLLDEQVLRLAKRDKEAILLRFYERKSLAEVGAAMGLSEEAAKKRVQRAVERLRGAMVGKGMTISAGALTVMVGTKVTMAAPAGFANSVVAMAMAGGGAGMAGAIAKGAIKMLTLAKIKVGVCLALGVLTVAMGGVVVAQMQASPTTSHSQAVSESSMTTRVYDLTDLVWSAPTTAPAGTSSAGPSREQDLKNLAGLICETVGQGSWEGQGTGQGTIRLSPTVAQFVITQTPAIHQAIESLLGRLRVSQTVQITIETRLITVDPAKMPADLAEVMDGPRSAANPGTLDVQQYRQLIQAQASWNGSIITAPRVTVFDGGSAQISAETLTHYVGGFKPSTKGGYEEVGKEVRDGISMMLSAAVSSDGRMINLHITPKMTTLLGMDKFTVVKTTGKAGPSDITVQQPRREELAMDMQAIVPDNAYSVIGKISVTSVDEAKPGIQSQKMFYVVVKPNIIRQRETALRAGGQTGTAAAPSAAGTDDLLLRVYEIADLTAVDTKSGRMRRATTRNAKTDAHPAREPREIAAELCGMIRKEIAPQSWQETGGAGVIRLSPLTAGLVVLQTAANHALIAQKLGALREDRSSQICVDVHFVTIDTARIPAAFRQALDPQAQPRKPFWPNDSQVEELLQLALSHKTAAVRLVNGGYAEVRHCDVTPFVGSLSPTTRASEVLYEANVEDADDGITLQVQGSATPDGRGAALDLRPTSKRLLEMRSFTFAEKGTEDRLTIQQPLTNAIEVDTQVIVPNGETLVLGGQTVASSPAVAAGAAKAAPSQTQIILVRPAILPKINEGGRKAE